jgi:capsular polysaccharide biosynthesis protein
MDAISLCGAGGHLLHRRVQPERRVSAGVWMVGVAASNYYHWLYDICSRSLAYKKFGAFPAGTVILVDEDALTIPQMVEILDLLNAHQLPIETVAAGEAVQVDRLFVASPATWSVIHLREGANLEPLDSIIHPQAVAALRSIAAPHLSKLKRGRRIFVSRKVSLNPRIANEAELAAVAQEEFGFELLDPSGLSFAEQVRAFSEAEAIIGASGAAMSNLAFCSQGAKAFCLMAQAFAWSGWQSIATAAGSELTHIAGRPLPGFHYNEYHARFTSDPDQLRDAMREMLGFLAA